MNAMEFNQAATFLSAVQAQVTGASSIATITPANFVSTATTLLQTGADTIMDAVSQVLSRTIFSVRPYYAKFPGMMTDEAGFGNHVRKIQFVDSDISDDDRYLWPVGYDAGQTPPDGLGQSVDQYIIKKPEPLQTNFYGYQVWEDWMTITEEQLRQAFTGPEQLNSFVSAAMTEWSNKLEQFEEDAKRGVFINYMGGILDEGSTDRVVNLLAEYNTAAGFSTPLTATTVYQPGNFEGFVKWAYARINTISDFMTERSQKFQTNITGKVINRHSPKANQRLYIHSPSAYQVQSMVLADVFNQGDLSVGDFERVNFWQSIETPDTINVTPVRIGSAGTEVTAGSAVTQAGVFGVLCDQDAFGLARIDNRLYNTPFNARGAYYNMWSHATYRTWNDHTEKGVIFIVA